jgi:membrane protein YdbS with pleckstrin-like domain
MLCYFFFILLWFRTIIKNALSKKVISVLLLTIVVITILNTSLQEFTNEYASHTFIVGTLFTASTATIYFVQILRSNDVLHIKHNLSFWITTGILVFNIAMIPIIAFQKYVPLAKGGSYFILLFALNLIFYSCISLGFIWSKQK